VTTLRNLCGLIVRKMLWISICSLAYIYDTHRSSICHAPGGFSPNAH
jgi:hypothetical protein